MTPPPATRRLGLIDATAMVISACIGIGIFFSPATVASRTGSGGWALAAWAVGGVVAVVGGLCFAELGALRPDMGGQFRVLREAWGRPVGFAYAGTSGLIINTGATAVLAGYGTDFLGQAFRWKLDGGAWLAVSLTILATLAVVNCIGLRRAADLLDLLTLGKLLTILGIGVGAILAAVSGNPAHEVSPFGFGATPTVGGFAFALMPVLFATGGWQQVLWTAGDIKNPGRNIPRALTFGIASVLTAYFIVNAACLWLLGAENAALSRSVASDALAVLHPDAGRWLAAAIGISAIGTTHVILISSSREQAAFGGVGDGPAFLAVVDPKTGAARRAVLAVAAWSMLLLVVVGRSRLESLLDAVVMADYLFLALAALAVLRFRATHPDAPRSFRTPGGPFLPITFAVVSFVVAATPWTVKEMRPFAFGVTGVVVALLLVGRIRARARCGTSGDS